MESGYCLECKRNTELVVDYQAGDTICAECGLVLEEHFIDEYSEWRIFTDDNNNKDPNRVGGRENPFLTKGNLATVITKPKDGSEDPVRRLHSGESNQEKTLILGFKNMATFADRLGLVETIKNRANEIYKKVEDQKTCRGRKSEAILAACLYIACKEEKLSRTFKEIGEAADGISGKDILRAAKLITKQVEVNMGTGQCVVELVRRFCSNLGMKNQDIKAVQEAYKKSEEFDIRRNPQSILAAIIYIISQLSDDKKPIRDISRAADVAQGTIKKSYKDVYPLASRLVPSWYAKEEDIWKIICAP